ncbi:endonuclease domain-containing protein [Polycyclovorans algicola]|uniref:endonuclease domain-containing protein n=1 Tax=Polycyclovorans algicola TaxID=616992 RepID=UPI00190FBAA5
MVARPNTPAARAPSPSVPLPPAGEGRKEDAASVVSPRPLAGEGGPKDRERAAPKARKRVTLKRAKALRTQQTDAEHRLWHHLRAGRFLGLKFKRQQPVGPYIADFICLGHRLIIEADGRQHNASPRDAARDAYLKAQGFRVLRFWNHDVLKDTDAVLEAIRLAVCEAPSPSVPLPQAGEGGKDSASFVKDNARQSPSPAGGRGVGERAAPKARKLPSHHVTSPDSGA